MEIYFNSINWPQAIIEVVMETLVLFFGIYCYRRQKQIDEKFKRSESKRLYIQNTANEIRIALFHYWAIYNDVTFYLKCLELKKNEADLDKLSKAFQKEDEAWQKLWSIIGLYSPFFKEVGIDAEELEKEHLNLVEISNPDFNSHLSIEDTLNPDAITYAVEETNKFTTLIIETNEILAKKSYELL